MKFWIIGALSLLVIGTLVPVIAGGPGAGGAAVQGFVAGLGVLALVLAIGGIVWLVRLPFRQRSS